MSDAIDRPRLALPNNDPKIAPPAYYSLGDLGRGEARSFRCVLYLSREKLAALCGR